MKCPICLAKELFLLYNEKEKFTNEDAIEFELDIKQCKNCGFVFLASAYTNEYEKIINTVYKNFTKSNNFPFPNKSIENIKTIDMISNHIQNTLNTNILEIGSNRGDLLFLIKEKFNNVNILGLEPTKYNEVYIPTINSFFNKELFSNKFKFIIMQHVLEHIPYPKNIVDSIYELLEDNGITYIEVPSLKYSLENNVEDYMLEHVSYFTKNSLLSLFDKFKVLEIHEKPFLRIVFQKLDSTIKSEANSVEFLQPKFNKFLDNKINIINSVKETIINSNKEIVFFGTSFYFRKIFNDIKKVIEIKNGYFIDDI